MMTNNFVNPFKSWTIKTPGKNKTSQGMRSEHFSPAEVDLDLGKEFLKSGTTAIDHLSRPGSLEHLNALRSPFLSMRADTRVEKQKSTLSKVKVVKNNITELFKSAACASETVTRIDHSVTHGFDHNAPNRQSSSPNSWSILPRVEPTVSAYESIPPWHTGLDAAASSTSYPTDVVEKDIEDVTSVVYGLSSQPLTKSESQLHGLRTAFVLAGLHTIEEEIEYPEVGVKAGNSERELARSGSFISQLYSDSGFTIYFSTDTLSDRTTPHGVSLNSPETSTLPTDTSFSTSVGTLTPEGNRQSLFCRLRRVPKYGDLRNSQIVVDRSSPCSSISCGSSDCYSSYGEACINVIPSPGYAECDDPKLEPRIYVYQTHKVEKPWAWFTQRYHAFARKMQKWSASRAADRFKNATRVAPSRQFFKNVFHPSSRVQVHALEQASSPLVWSCARIAGSSSKSKIEARRRMTKQSMGELKAHLNTIDIDPWY